MNEEIRIEAYVPHNKIVDASDLIQKLNLNAEEMEEAISEAHSRGHHLFNIGGKIFLAKNSNDLDMKLLQIRDMFDLTDI